MPSVALLVPARPSPRPWRGAWVTVALLLAGCESTPEMPKTPELPSVPAVVEVDGVTSESDVTDRVGQAAITPLTDLNVVQQKIPPVLIFARDVGAYSVPEKLDCVNVQDEINRLDAALGADFDAAGKGKPSLLERGGDMAENYGVGFVRRTMEGFVPFRSWLRKLSGAEKHSKQIAAAITAGGVRRAYLKGLRQGLGCPVPVPPKATKTAAAAKAASEAASAAAEMLPAASQPIVAAPAPAPASPSSGATAPQP